MRIVVILVFVGILGSLASALFYLMRDKGASSKTVNALTLRIGMSVLLFLFLLFSHWMGWIETTGVQR
ncbi:MAG: twin transmembrane helix small protein [Alcaligenaceae bacterium]